MKVTLIGEPVFSVELTLSELTTLGTAIGKTSKLSRMNAGMDVDESEFVGEFYRTLEIYLRKKDEPCSNSCN